MTKFSNLQSAIRYQNHCISPSKWAIILGDDSYFWLVSNRDASRLVKQGYEFAIY